MDDPQSVPASTPRLAILAGISGLLLAGMISGAALWIIAAITAGLGSPLKGGVHATMRGTPATEAVSTDICAEATIGNLPPGT